MNSKRLLLTVFIFTLLFAVILQVLVQTSLAPPMHDAQFVGKHLNRYDIQLSKAQQSNRVNLKSGAIPTKIKNVVEQTAPVTEDSVKSEEFAASIQAPVHFLKTVSDLERDYGKGANLTHSEARDLYLEVIKDAKVGFNAWLASHMTAREQAQNNQLGNAKDGKHTPSASDYESVDVELEHAAVLCSIARSRSRRYIRDRMSDRMGAWFLFVRDAWKYGARDLMRAVLADSVSSIGSYLGFGAGEPIAQLKTTDSKATGISEKESSVRQSAPISQSGAALASMGACLSSDDSHPCPAFSYLQHVRKRDAKAILKSCFRSNEFYNQWFATEEGKAAVAGKAGKHKSV